MTTEDYLTQLQQDKSDLVDNLTTMGIEDLTGDETFTELVPEVLNISGGGSIDEYFNDTLTENTSSGLSIMDKLVKKMPPITIASNVTSLVQAFYNFKGTETPTLNILSNNLTSFSYMFQGCSSLINVSLFDTSSGTNFSGMFIFCSALTTIPLFDMSSGTNFNGMFQSCSSLTTVPQLNTSSGTNFGNMFTGCTNLTTVPIFDLSSATTFSNMFSSCSALTNQSLDNIMASLLTATSYTGTKTLRQIGLSSTQATTCTTLSNWSALETAGWTTGF